MMKLDGIRCVLSGGIDRVRDDGIVWRKNIKKRCAEEGLNIKFFDPCDKPNGLGSEVGVEKKKVKELLISGRWQEAREFVRTFRHYDLRAIDWSDFVIVKIDIDAHLCGTYNEVFLAESQRKPIFVIMGDNQKKEDIPSWLVAFINEWKIFETEEECVRYLIQINLGAVQLDERWVKID